MLLIIYEDYSGIVLVTVTIGTAVCGATPIRAVVETSYPSQLLWHDDEAFVFLGTGQWGRNSSYAYYLLSMISAFGAPPQDYRKMMVVFRITSDTVEEHHLDGPVPSWLIAADGYVSSYDARWIAGRFEPYTPRKIPEAFVKDPPQEFSDVDGWSKRMFLVPSRAGAQEVDFELRGGSARLVISVNTEIRTIDLDRAGMPVKRLLTTNNRARRVSLSEYNQIFGK